ncbi:FISUMP domain-containing protein [Ichthyenterobacterium sp. W332]|uniref:FISUMP domain-containing protein n=1 Tax=Microcosmobacter mediterraneus TaxID=3075607 RepID=A0ABU2YKC9_9FLAO|nr:FISUMP domain-containing protein [Ichthyenterobacterium sp. W332]MDT0557473.1 FISUMP domain-containing protein [Ichthyenterobacterium sp. W332]
MKKLFKLSLLALVALLFVQCSNDDNTPDNPPIQETVTDADGNVYNTITIGNQTWMLENLKTTKYNDGSPITEWVFGESWGSLNNQQDFYQWAGTDDLSNIHDEELPFDYYGAMYNHFALESGKLAPQGWRIPSKQDFMELENYLAENGFAGNVAQALKSETGWSEFSGSGSNASGFNGLPNGYVAAGGTATASEAICSWVTSDVADGAVNSSLTRTWVQLFDETDILYSDTSIVLGAAVRCIKE